MTPEDTTSVVNSTDLIVGCEHYVVILDEQGVPIAAARREMVRFGVRRPYERLRRVRGKTFETVRSAYEAAKNA